MSSMEKLNAMRKFGGSITTIGLSDGIIMDFISRDTKLVEAIDAAYEIFRGLQDDMPELLAMAEVDQLHHVQADYVNFYSQDGINPYVSAAASGPWIITLKGAVLHDNGGYGMLGFGHAPAAILEAMNQPHVMANIMTPSISQKRLTTALKKEIGHTRGNCPFEKFLCLNSGSESVSLGARLADINAKLRTDPGGPDACKQIKKLSLTGGFHGRTDRPAQFSDSTRQIYVNNLATFRDRDNLITVDPNSLEQLEQVYHYAANNNIFIEAFFMEPVMGEGNPGHSITPEFYNLARKLTREHGSLLLVDSIQAGLRAHGVLSIVDYPGFETADAPDLETYSKALNGGQYPFSVVAMTAATAALYRKGVYGNTMTTNPRALDVACAVLDSLTPELRENIRNKGHEFVEKLEQLRVELGDRITGVQGCGLLFSAELDGSRYKAYGAGSSEEYMRQHGINVIHGGENSLRFTPHFAITSAEVDMIIDATRVALLKGPVKASKSEAA